MEPIPPAWFVAKDRAKRFAFRLEQVAKERATTWAGDRVGMTSFAEIGPVLRAIEQDVFMTVDSVVARRLRDRERGETEIPLVAALEGVLERIRRAARLAEMRRASRAPAEWAERRFLELLWDAVRRLDAFAEVYDAKRLVAVPAPADVGRMLARTEADAALDLAGSIVTAPPEPRGEVADRPIPRLVTAADALEDLLRAARAEVPDAPLPWRVTPPSPASPLGLALGDVGPAAAAEPAPLDADPARERTGRAADVLRFAHGVRVARVVRADGVAAGISVALEDASAKAVGGVVAAGAGFTPQADAAVRAYLVATGKGPGPLDPARLVAAAGVLRAVDRECERVLASVLHGSAPRVVAAAVPREASRKAPVRREVVATLAAAIEGFPVHRVNEVLDTVAEGKATAAHLRPPDAAVLLAVLGRRWAAAGGFGGRVLPLEPLDDGEVMASIRDVLVLHALEQALERGRDPGADWPARFEAAAFGLLARLSKAKG